MKKKFKFVIVIPARLKSSRFPGKPLAKICGKPMIYHVWKRCIDSVDKKLVFVATDNTKIINICKKFGIQATITSTKCKTGTDRMYDFSKKINSKIYINIQGDEPLINPKDIKKVIKNCLKTKNRNSIYNGMCKVTNYKDAYKSQLPKVVFNNKKELLYMSRAPIPNNKKLNNENFYKQVCIYSIPKKLLEIFGKRKKTYFENIEDIEIIRFLELGFVVKMIELSDTISVDFPSDIKKVERILQKNKNLYA